jgi:hypothetical protein
MLSPDQRVAMSPDVIYRTIGEEAVLLNLETGIYFGLDPIGTRIWELALEHDVRTVCRTLEAEFDATPEVIERDVLALLDSLLAKGLLTTNSELPR